MTLECVLLYPKKEFLCGIYAFAFSRLYNQYCYVKVHQATIIISCFYVYAGQSIGYYLMHY